MRCTLLSGDSGTRTGRLLRRCAIFCALILPETAHAHAMFGSAAPFWSGVLHVLVTPLALAAMAALAIALAEAAESAILCAVIGAAIAGFGAAERVSATMPAGRIEPIAAACVAIVGMVVVGLITMRRRPSAWLASALGVGSGIAAGSAVATDVPDWGGSFGVGVALLVLGSWGAAALAHLQLRFARHADRARSIAATSIAALAAFSVYNNSIT